MWLVALSTLYIMFYAGIRPHWDNKRVRLEISNEVLIMMFNYLMIIFSDYCLNSHFQFHMGTSFAVLLGIVVFVNISNMVRLSVEKSKRVSKINQLKVN